MSLKFTWDKNKAEFNIRKHGISFEEASTVFTDPLSLTIDDPLHSYGEERSVIIGQSFRNRLLVVVHTDMGDTVRIISARPAIKKKGRIMNQNQDFSVDEDMLEEYDFSKGVRGKYVGRFKEGCNVVLLEPDVAEVFTDAESVNNALRNIARIIRNQTTA